MNEHLIAAVVEACVVSSEVAHSIIEGKPSLVNVTKLVCGAPLPLEEKARLLEMLCPLPGFLENRGTELTPSITPPDQLAAHLRAINELALIADDEFLCLYQYWRSEDSPYGKDGADLAGIFPSYQDALDWIARYRAYEEIDIDSHLISFYLEKWRRAKTTEEHIRFEKLDTFYFVGDRVCYAQRNHLHESGLWWKRAQPWNFEANVRMPFAAGDLIRFSPCPVSGDMFAVVIEPECEELTDCCFPQILYRDQDGYLQIAAFKHLGTRVRGTLAFSPIYTAQCVADSADIADEVLLTVASCLHDDATRGRRLWDALNDINCWGSKYDGISELVLWGTLLSSL